MNNSADMLDQDLPPTTPEALFEVFQDIDIQYENHHHDPIFTVEEGVDLKKKIPGTHCRNLFLRDKKKRMFLVVLANETQVDIKILQKALECGRLSFGSPERLWTHLGIRPGSVCPFCAINDHDHQVQIVLDAEMMRRDIVNYHPLDNAMTVSLTPADLLKFFNHTGHSLIYVEPEDIAPEEA